MATLTAEGFLGFPLWGMYAVAAAVDVLRHLLRRDLMLTTQLLRLMHMIPPTGSQQGGA